MHTPQKYEKRNNNFERWERFVYEGDDPVVYQTMLDILNGKAVIEKMCGFNVYKTRVGSLRILFLDLGGKCFAFLLKLEGHRYERLPFKKNQGYLNAALERLGIKDALQNDECYEPPEDTQGVDEKFYYFNRSIVLPNQQQKETLNLSTPLVVTGGAGSGKTMMALIWIKSWLTEQNEQPILYVSPNRELANRMTQELLCHNISTAEVHCLSYQDLILQNDSTLQNLESVNSNDFYIWYADYLKKQRHPKPHTKLTKDLDVQVYEVLREIAHNNYSSCNTTRTSRNRDSLLHAYTDDIYKIFDAYMAFLSATKKYDIALHNPNLSACYSGCLVDEAQQLTPIQWQVLCQVVTPTLTGLKIIFVGDEQNQRLLDQQCLLTEKLTRLNAICATTHITLDSGYRIPKNIQTINNNLVQLKKSVHRDLKTSMVSNEYIQEGYVSILEYTPETQAICANMVLSPKCFVITLEKSRQRAARRFGSSALIFTVDEVGGQECEQAIIFELFGQDEDDFLLMSVSQRTSLKTIHFDNQQPVLIQHGNSDYYIYGFNGQQWQLKKLSHQFIVGFDQLVFPEQNAEPIYLQFGEKLRPIYDYLISINAHVGQDEPHLLELEKSLVTKKSPKKVKNNEFTAINTWINSRIIACSRACDGILIVLPSQNKYPLLYNLLRNETSNAEIPLLADRLDSVALQQDWLATADEFVLSRNTILINKAKQIYAQYGISIEQAEEKINLILEGSIVVGNNDENYLTQFERNALINCLRSNNLSSFFQTHKFNIFQKIFRQQSKGNELSVIDTILYNKSYSKSLYDYLLNHPENFQELENIYSGQELFLLIRQSKNNLLLQLLLAFGQDETMQDDNCYPKIKQTCQQFMRQMLTMPKRANTSYALQNFTQYLIDADFVETALVESLGQTIVALITGDTELAINVFQDFFPSTNSFNINAEKYNNLTIFEQINNSMLFAIALGNIRFFETYVSKVYTHLMLVGKALLLKRYLVDCCKVSVDYENYSFLTKFLFYLNEIERGNVLILAIELQHSQMLDLCLEHQITFLSIPKKHLAAITHYARQNILLKETYNRYVLTRAVIKDLSDINLRNYFDFLIQNNSLKRALDTVKLKNELYEEMLGFLMATTEFESFLVQDIKQNNFKESIVNKIATQVIVDFEGVGQQTVLAYAANRGARWFLKIYLEGYLSEEKSIMRLITININIVKTTTLLTTILCTPECNEMLCVYLEKNISQFIQICSLYTTETLLGMAMQTQSVKLLQLMIVHGKKIPENIMSNTGDFATQQLICYNKFKTHHANAMKIYLLCDGFKLNYTYLDELYNSYKNLMQAILYGNKFFSNMKSIIYGEFDREAFMGSSEKLDPQVLFIAILIGHLDCVVSHIEKYTLDVITSTYCILAAFFEQYNIFKIFAPGIDIIRNTESLFFAILKNDYQMIDIIVQQPIRLELLHIDQQTFLKAQKDTEWFQDLMQKYPMIIDFFTNLDTIKKLTVAFERLQIATDLSLASLNEEQKSVIQVIAACSVVDINQALTNSNLDRLPIHAAIECRSLAVLNELLKKDSSSVNTSYQGVSTFMMVMMRYELMPLATVVSMLNTLVKHGVVFVQHETQQFDCILESISEKSLNPKDLLCLRLIRTAAENAGKRSQLGFFETSQPQYQTLENIGVELSHSL